MIRGCGEMTGWSKAQDSKLRMRERIQGSNPRLREIPILLRVFGRHLHLPLNLPPIRCVIDWPQPANRLVDPSAATLIFQLDILDRHVASYLYKQSQSQFANFGPHIGRFAMCNFEDVVK